MHNCTAVLCILNIFFNDISIKICDNYFEISFICILIYLCSYLQRMPLPIKTLQILFQRCKCLQWGFSLQVVYVARNAKDNAVSFSTLTAWTYANQSQESGTATYRDSWTERVCTSHIKAHNQQNSGLHFSLLHLH